MIYALIWDRFAEDIEFKTKVGLSSAWTKFPLHLNGKVRNEAKRYTLLGTKPQIGAILQQEHRRLWCWDVQPIKTSVIMVQCGFHKL